MKAIYVSQEENILERTDRIVAVSNGTKAWLRDSYGIAKSIDVAYNGVDLQEFSCAKERCEEVEPYLLFVGALRPMKGINILIDSLSIIAKERVKVPKTLIVGTGPLESLIRERVRKSDFGDRVRVEGFVSREQLKLLYRHAAVYVLPSLHEGLPTTVLEAMASSLPVVASNIPGTNEVVQNESNGILFPPGDASSLAKSIAYLMDNPDVRRKLGKSGRRIAEERYGWPTISKKYVELYNSIAS
jgi:glycosyltransferase involved in cell wall biosynthesis